MSEVYVNWLEERNKNKLIVPRWRQPIAGIVALIIAFAVALITWYWLFNPLAPGLRLYTPLYGYMWDRWLLICCIWMAYVFDYTLFFKREWVKKLHPAIKGMILTAITIIVMVFTIYVIFDLILGHLGIPYFSFEMMEKVGNLVPSGVPGHITPFYAREYVSMALLMIAAIASWLSPAIPVYFGYWPWGGKLKQPVLGVTILLVTMLPVFYLFFILMHPHMALLFVPWQVYTASLMTPEKVGNWWYEIAGTLHGNFNVAWIMAMTCTVWYFESIWEREPFFTISKKQPWRGIISFLGTTLFALGTFYALQILFASVLGPATEGAFRRAGYMWRYLHAAEWFIFYLCAALTISFFFDNWPRRWSGPVNWIIRNILALIGAVMMAYFYYELGPIVLGTTKGLDQPEQYPMVWGIWYVNILLIMNWFFDNWPAYKPVYLKKKE